MKPLVRNLSRLLCIGAGAALASSAYAQGYVGIGVGQGNASLPSVSTTVLGLAFTGASDKSSATAYKLYGGYQFTPNWGLEAGYNDLGNKYSVAGSLGGTPYNATYKMDNWYVAATGTLPLQGGFSLLGKIGGEMIMTDPVISRLIAPSKVMGYFFEAAFCAAALIFGRVPGRRGMAKKGEGICPRGGVIVFTPPSD